MRTLGPEHTPALVALAGVVIVPGMVTLSTVLWPDELATTCRTFARLWLHDHPAVRWGTRAGTLGFAAHLTLVVVDEANKQGAPL